MKRPKTILALMLITLLPLKAEESAKHVFRDAATHDTLAHKLRAVEATDPMNAMEKAEGKDPSIENQPQNLIESSDLISFQGLTTLVPKRAIMKLPEQFKDRINNHQPGNRVVGWLDFYALNKGWITTVEISRKQAGGREDFDPALAEQLGKSKNMIVTVMASGPISYMPYRGDGETKTEAEIK
jgi:hypothetical protein